MGSPRRIGAPDAKNRTVLLDAAEQMILDEGYAAVTSRRVAEKAGLKPQLVHYYFRTMDDLYLAVFRRRVTLNDPGTTQRDQRNLPALAGLEPRRSTGGDVQPLAPGQRAVELKRRVRFREVTLNEAQRFLLQRERDLGLFALVKDAIGTHQSQPSVDIVAVGLQPFSQSIDHAVDHRLLLVGRHGTDSGR